MNPNFWKNKRIAVTGGTGFLGTHVVSQLKKYQPKEIRAPHSTELDLRIPKNCAKLVKGTDLVIHLAGRVGGIGYNQKYPGTLFYDNILMGTHMMEEARKASVNKFVAVGTICAYPKHTSVPFREADLWNGYPEETNASYGLAKKMLLVQGQAYHQQYGFNSIYLLPVNLYGPGDNFDPVSSHVIPSLIKKFCDAIKIGAANVVVWGTGKPTREFLYVEDAARGILLATEKYNSIEAVNLGSSYEISIKDLAHMIKKITGFKGQIIFDTSKPDGQPRRKLDVTRAKQEFGFESIIEFEKGLATTVEWYLRHQK